MSYFHHPIFPATEPLSLGQLRKGGSNCHFQGTFDSKKILINTIVACSLQLLIIEFASGMRRNIRYLQRDQRKMKSKSISNPISLTVITQEQQTMPQARATTRSESRDADRKASEQAAHARTVENGQLYITNESVMGGNRSTHLRRAYSDRKNSQSSR